MYDRMVSEMLRFAGFQDGVNERLRSIHGLPTEQEARWIDDLYSIYADRQVIDDED
jgi:hypothetical protein